MLIGKISLPLISYSVAKTTAAKKLQNLKNEFVKIYRVLREIIKHINVKFELLCRPEQGSCYWWKCQRLQPTDFLPKTKKKLWKTQNEFVKFYTFLVQTMTHITVKIWSTLLAQGTCGAWKCRNRWAQDFVSRHRIYVLRFLEKNLNSTTET